MGVFFAKNDLSLSTLLGSGSYNLLVISSLCSFCVYKLNIKLSVYPVIRDSLFYALNLVFFYVFLYKNNYALLHWYDSLASIVIYLAFIGVNLFDSKIAALYNSIATCKLCKGSAKDHTNNGDEPAQNDIELVESLNPEGATFLDAKNVPPARVVSIDSSEDSDYDEPYDMFNSYKKFRSLPCMKKIKLIFVFPARSIAFLCILDFRRFEKFKNAMLFVTIFLSLFLVGLCSYILVWMVLIICETLHISETILGFSILAAATSMEETITSISICRREIKRIKTENTDSLSKLNMALSNCIGSNIFDLSIGIGLPYLLNSLFFTQGFYFTRVYSGNITFIVVGLLICLSLYLALLKGFKWRLAKSFGFMLLFIWVVYTSLVILLEMNVFKLSFFNFGIKKC